MQPKRIKIHKPSSQVAIQIKAPQNILQAFQYCKPYKLVCKPQYIKKSMSGKILKKVKKFRVRKKKQEKAI